MTNQAGFNPKTATDAEKIREAVRWFDTFDKLAEVMHVEEHDTKAKYVIADLTRGREIQDDLLRIAERLEAGGPATMAVTDGRLDFGGYRHVRLTVVGRRIFIQAESETRAMQAYANEVTIDESGRVTWVLDGRDIKERGTDTNQSRQGAGGSA